MTVRPGERLLPQLLRERGYSTAAIVSASLPAERHRHQPGIRFLRRRDAAESGGTGRPSRRERDGGESEKIAEHWLDSAGTSRVFLFLHLNEPHKPYAPPERFSQYSPYDGEIAYADEIVGRLIQYLKTHQLYDRSTIVLLSDHGEGLGDHGEQEHGLFVYDEAIRVPLIIKQESNVGAGRRIPDLVQHVDMVPTILDLVKAPVPDNLRGRSLKPLLEDTGSPPRAARLFRGALRALSLRLERADGPHRRPLPVHQRAARGAVRPDERSRVSARIWPVQRPAQRMPWMG